MPTKGDYLHPGRFQPHGPNTFSLCENGVQIATFDLLQKAESARDSSMRGVAEKYQRRMDDLHY